MNWVWQLSSMVVQGDTRDRTAGVVTAQWAMASALLISWSAFRSWTNNELASMWKPSTVGSWKTPVMGTVVSPKRVGIVAAISAALSRRSRRGPGLGLPPEHALSLGSAGGGAGMALPPDP